MAHDPNEHFTNDDHVEIVDLEPEHTTKVSSRFNVSWGSAILPRRFSIVLRVAIVLSLLILSVLIVPNGLPLISKDARNILNSIIPPPLPASSTMLYLDMAIPGTRVTLDGQTIDPPRIASETPLTLSRGQHTLTWSIAPFLTQHCTLFIPSSRSDTCHFSYVHASYHKHLIRVVLLNESLSTLPPAQSRNLEQSITQALQSLSGSASVAPGELFTGYQGPIQARVPLIAQLNFSLAASDSQGEVACPDFATMLVNADIPCQLDGQSCIELCNIPWQARSYYLQGVPSTTTITHPWLALALVHADWSYSTLDGKSADSDLLFRANGPGFDEQVLLLRINWHTSWQVHILVGSELRYPLYGVTAIPTGFASSSSINTLPMLVNDNPACSVAMADALRGTASPPVVDVTGSLLYNVQLYAAPNPSTGCLMEESNVNTLQVASEASPVAEYLVRFGVLLAANEQAHLAQPTLPSASADALRVAQQLQQFLPFSVTLKFGNG